MENRLTVTINKTELPIKEYNGQRVVTLKEIDAVHERPEGTARKRFNDNRKRFIEGVDYFKVSPNERPASGRSIFDVAATTESDVGIDYSGFIYMAYDKSSKLIKIDRTRHKVSRRLQVINSGRTDPITEYEQFPCKDTLEAEKKIHQRLIDHRKIGEWFDVAPEVARAVIREAIQEVDDHFDPSKRHRGGARNDITLITETGYLMLVKSFTDDLAWTVQRQLVNTYFQSSPEQRREAGKQTLSDEARAQLEASTRRADAMLLNAKNRAASILQRLYDRAGVKPEYQAMAFSDFYSVDGVNLSREAYQDMKQTYDKGAIAEKLGVYSKASGGKTPHAQAIGAIIATLDLSEDERERLPYCNNGHDGVDYQYTESVVEKVWAWLEAHNRPSPITVNGKNYAVIYRKDG